MARPPSERAGCLAAVIVFYLVGAAIVGFAVWTRQWTLLCALVIWVAPTWWLLETRPLDLTRDNVDLYGPEATAAEFTNEPWQQRHAREAAEEHQWPTVGSSPSGQARAHPGGEWDGAENEPRGPRPGTVATDLRWEQPPRSTAP